MNIGKRNLVKKTKAIGEKTILYGNSGYASSPKKGKLINGSEKYIDCDDDVCEGEFDCDEDGVVCACDGPYKEEINCDEKMVRSKKEEESLKSSASGAKIADNTYIILENIQDLKNYLDLSTEKGRNINNILKRTIIEIKNI